MPQFNETHYEGIKVRKIPSYEEGLPNFNPLRNTLRKDDFKSFVKILKESLQEYLSKTEAKTRRLFDLKELVESSLNKADAHKAIRDRVSAKVTENSSSKAALIQYLYNFILQHENEGTIDSKLNTKIERKTI